MKFLVFGPGDRIRTCDLDVMSVASRPLLHPGLTATTLTHNRGLLSNDGRHTSREPHRHAALPAPPRGVSHILEQELRALRAPALASKARRGRFLVKLPRAVVRLAHTVVGYNSIGEIKTRCRFEVVD